MYSLKRKVRNRVCPEGSIAEAYVIDELVYFCSRYFDLKVQTKFNRPQRTYDGGEVEPLGRLSIFTFSGRSIEQGKSHIMNDVEYKAACLYILHNCDEVYPYIEYVHYYLFVLCLI